MPSQILKIGDIRKLKQGSYAIGGAFTGEDENFDFKSLVGKNILIKGAAVNTYRKVLAVNVTSSLIGMKNVFLRYPLLTSSQ